MGTVGSAQLVIMQSMILFSVVACTYGGYNGGCVNNLGQGVECASATTYNGGCVNSLGQGVECASATTYNGACVNSLGQGVPCRERRSAQEGQYSPAAEPYVHVEIAAEPY